MPTAARYTRRFRFATRSMEIAAPCRCLWPIVETLHQAPRIIGGTPANTIAELVRMFFFPIRSESDDGEFYVGLFVVPAALVGLARRRSIGLEIAALLCGWLAAGFM